MITIILNKFFPSLKAQDILEKQVERAKIDLLTYLELQQHSSAMVTMLQKRLTSLQTIQRSDKWKS